MSIRGFKYVLSTLYYSLKDFVFTLFFTVYKTFPLENYPFLKKVGRCHGSTLSLPRPTARGASAF